MGTSELSGKPDEMLGDNLRWIASHPGGVAIFLVSSCYGNWDKLRLCGPLGSCADFTFFMLLRHWRKVQLLKLVALLFLFCRLWKIFCTVDPLI